MIALTLPYPPSANLYWRHFRGRTVISGQARAYRAAVTILCTRNHVSPLAGDVCFEARLYRPRKSGDLDNRLKILLDCLQGHAFADDSQVVEIHLERFDDKKRPRVEVVIKEAGAK